ncbi:tetratricopeptide repeat-containing protein [Desulfovibrio sp. OttesenSCG-928-A18]|nr:tetratricopeptide repeat-containing protein [Desulfovibrio sp. OttesenSCG-928-A18]
MKQKIEWYREVLELEPGSRVFFPLAKLLAADGQASEAIFTLKQGLLRHPDHVEARLLLVELLFMQDAGAELQVEIDGLGALFASYPAFWTAWSERISETPALHDAALAMRFFGAALQGKNISWGNIIEQGLHNILGPAEAPAGHAPMLSMPRTDARTLAAIHKTASVNPPGYVQQPSMPYPAGEAQRPGAVENGFFASTLHGSEEEETEEAFSLRTRTMAEVLAEQGDINGALEIFKELMQEAPAEEKASLEARMSELTAQKEGSAVAAEESQEAEKNAPAPGAESTRLVSLLESLAQRLEARAR